MTIPPPVLFAMKSALEVGTAVTGVLSAGGAAAAQAEANQVAKENAIEARNANYDQLMAMSQQETASAEQQMRENDIDALKATERAKVAAGESGVTGLSVDALLADMYGKQARFTDNVNQNLENKQQQIDFERDNAERGYRSTINNLPTVQKPSYAGAFLRAGSGVFGAYKDHLKVKAK